jgi:hypothetical protein
MKEHDFKVRFFDGEMTVRAQVTDDGRVVGLHPFSGAENHARMVQNLSRELERGTPAIELTIRADDFRTLVRGVRDIEKPYQAARNREIEAELNRLRENAAI